MREPRSPAGAPVALLLGLLSVAGCGTSSSPVPTTEVFSGAIQDAPPIDAPGDTYTLRLRAGGPLDANLAWEEPPPAQPLGRAWLRLQLEDGRGQVVLDTIDAPLQNPTRVATAVTAGDYTLTITARPRDRIAFYCLCRVPYSVTLTHR